MYDGMNISETRGKKAMTDAYTIKEAAEHTGIPEETIRYYERIGILPHAERKPNRHRVYRPKDLETMQLVTCLKKTGMPLEEMKPFLKLSVGDDISEHPELHGLILEHRAKIREQMDSLQQILDFIDSQVIGTAPEAECGLADQPKRFGFLSLKP
ncbi:MerR family transcriptional regulator [Paenibacillus sp. AR247]|nr:MerR family transcriptional regulator [Paenibacillus sp. AR247]